MIVNGNGAAARSTPATLATSVSAVVAAPIASVADSLGRASAASTASLGQGDRARQALGVDEFSCSAIPLLTPNHLDGVANRLADAAAARHSNARAQQDYFLFINQ
jgi:hypothetical protein